MVVKIQPPTGRLSPRMIFSLFNRRRQRGKGIEPLYGAMMANALEPRLFIEGGIPDTFEGRFESVTLQAALVLRRLKALPDPASAVSQDLVDRIFDGLDAAMRESGVSDGGVPKRIKKFAQGFYGRLEVYTAALELPQSSEALASALRRNIVENDASAHALAAIAVGLDERLSILQLNQIAAGNLPQVAKVAAHV